MLLNGFKWLRRELNGCMCCRRADMSKVQNWPAARF